MHPAASIPDGIPEPFHRLAQRLGCRADGACRQVELRQVGQMRQDHRSAWMPFKAQQRIAIDRCTFDWTATTGPAGLVQVRDAFSDGHGSLSVKLLGIVPIAGAPSSPELDRGEAMRYLAELAWAPDAVLSNPELNWRSPDDANLVVATGHGPRRAEVAFKLDPQGRIAEAFAADRPRSVGKTFVRSAWRGVFSDYRVCEGRLVPMSAEVGWVTQGDFEPVWRGTIVDWRTV